MVFNGRKSDIYRLVGEAVFEEVRWKEQIHLVVYAKLSVQDSTERVVDQISPRSIIPMH